MIERISKRQGNFYQFSLLLTIFTTLGILLYFWKLGFIDGTRSKDLHKASYILETYEKKDTIKEVSQLIYRENPKAAITKIKAIESELENVHLHVDVKSYETLQGSIKDLQTSAAQLISFSKVDKVINVFNTKMNRFYDYVKINNWRTLTRMSQRVFSQTTGYINKNKISTLVSNVSKDFDSMVKITENSVLSRKDKAEIKSRISNLRIEMEMLNKYAIQRNKFDKQYKNTKGHLKEWLADVAPQLTLEKVNIEQIGRYYVMGLLGILTLVTGLFFGSFLFQKWVMRKNLVDIEAEIKSYINQGILEQKHHSFDQYSVEFQNFSRNISEYVEKRMSFGSIFQDSLPFSSILLDKNLKVIWANKVFCEAWDIQEEEINKDYMSWDFLSKLTNLGTNDPILEALKNNIAGIYQVQVKINEDADTRPFEMFVSPVKYNGQTRIQLFFYDLTNIEETIQEQAKSILTPVKKSLTALQNGEDIATEEISRDFQVAGLGSLHVEFKDLQNTYDSARDDLLNQIEFLHSKIENLESDKADLLGHNQSFFSLSKESLESLKVFKNSVIRLSTISSTLENTTLKQNEMLNTNVAALGESSKKVFKLSEAMAEVQSALPKFINVKEDIRTSKASLYEAKSKLAHELAQLSLLMKRANDSASIEKLSRTLSKVNNSFESLNLYSEDLDKKVSNLELLLSKANMIVQNASEKVVGISNEFENQQLKLTSEELLRSKKILSEIDGERESQETQIIESLQTIFSATKNTVKLCKEINDQSQSVRVPEAQFSDNAPLTN